MKTSVFLVSVMVIFSTVITKVHAQLKEKAVPYTFNTANTILIDTNISIKEVGKYLINKGYMIKDFNQDFELIETESFDIFKGWAATAGYMKIWKDDGDILITGYIKNNMTYTSQDERMELKGKSTNKGRMFYKVNDFALQLAKDYGVKVYYLKL